MLYAGALIYQQMQHMQKRIDKLSLFPQNKCYTEAKIN